MPKYTHMVCLVGENPLPIWLGIHQFMPSKQETANIEAKPIVRLVYSSQTKKVAEHLQKQLQHESDSGLHEIRCLFDADGELKEAFSPQAMRETLKKLNGENLSDLDDYALNYTGGTKVMAAYFLHDWMTTGRSDRAFYLQETNGQFHFDSGTPYPLKPTIRELTLDTLERLHGANPHSLRPNVPCNKQDCVNFYNAHQSGELAKIKKKSSDKWNPLEPSIPYFHAQVESEGTWRGESEWAQIFTLLTDNARTQWQQSIFYSDDTKQKLSEELKEQFRFAFKNEWLEWLVMFWLKEVLPDSKVTTGKKFKIEGQEFEADALVVHKNRLYYFSVTTKLKPDECKEKMFEAIHRSRQLGGGLARSCTICLADEYDDYESGKKVDTVSAIRKSLTSSDKIGNHTIFGLKEITKWLTDENIEDMETFINQ